MKVEISDQGQLCIDAENALEYYALKCWYDKNKEEIIVGNQQAFPDEEIVINTFSYAEKEENKTDEDL